MALHLHSLVILRSQDTVWLASSQSVPVRMVALLCAPSANTTIRSRDMMAVRLEPNHGLRSCENDATVEAHRKLDAKSSSFAVILDSCGLIARPTIPGKLK